MKLLDPKSHTSLLLFSFRFFSTLFSSSILFVREKTNVFSATVSCLLYACFESEEEGERSRCGEEEKEEEEEEEKEEEQEKVRK